MMIYLRRIFLTGFILIIPILTARSVGAATDAGQPKTNTSTSGSNKLASLDDRKSNLRREMEVANPDYFAAFNLTIQPNCSLHHIVDYNGVIKKQKAGGAKMIKIQLDFPEYDENPMLAKSGFNYRPDRWYRTFDTHGRTLLTLAFNYDIVSLYTLLFGVEAMDVKLLDEPRNCFGELSEEDKLTMALNLIRSDFQPEEKLSYSGLGSDPHVCYEVLAGTDGSGKFTVRCCKQRYDGETMCTENKMGKWVTIIYNLICIIKVLAFGFAPVAILWVVKDGSLRRTAYTVLLKNEHPQKLWISEINNHPTRCAYRRDDKKFATYRSIIDAGKVPMQQTVMATFKKIHLVIDQRRLMTQKSVPVGLFHYIYKSLFLCHIRENPLFESCCETGCCGGWTRRFLGIDLDSHCKSCTCKRRWPSWSTIARFVGAVMLMFTIPIPYYIRLAIYYGWEEDELLNRTKALDAVGLTYTDWFHTLHYISPTNGGFILIYVLYFASFILLGYMYHKNKELFTKIVLEAIQDMRHVRYGGCFRFLATHILLPFEKFGICIGLLVGMIYWIFVLIIFACMLVFYCIPTIYLTFRLLKWTRPCHTDPRHENVGRTYDDKGVSWEKRLFLDDISPSTVTKKTNTGCLDDCACVAGGGKKSFAQALAISILCIVCMWTVVILFGESIGFIVEILVFTLMGGIVNASSAAKYIMLAFWMLMYSTTCFNHVHDKYLALNKKIFELIKSKREADIKEVILQRERDQKDTAFKYFANNEECECEKWAPPLSSSNQRRFDTDTLVNIDNEIYWRMNSLILFISTKDVPRIPRRLFHAICQITAPGCPGPIEKNLMKAARQLSYMILFLFFVLIVVMAFGDAYQISSTNQMLVTLAGGFVPFIIRFVIQPKKGEVSLNTYTFEGKIHQIIHNFNQEWPAYDLDFEVSDPNAEVTTDAGQDPSVEAGDISVKVADGEDDAQDWNGVKQPEEIPLKEITVQPSVDDSTPPILIPECSKCARMV